MSALTAVVLNLDIQVDGESEWWHDPALLGRIVVSLKRRGLWLDFAYVGKEGATLDRFASVDEVLEASTRWLDRPYVLHTHGEGGIERAFEGSYVSFSLGGGDARVQLNVAPPALDARRPTLLDDLVHFVCDVHDALDGYGRIGPQAVVEQHGVRYPNVRPPRVVELPFAEGSLLEAYDLRYFEQNRRKSTGNVAKLLAAAPPDGCLRIEHRGLVVFRWAAHLADDAEIAAGCAREERFLADVLEPPILRSFDAAGNMRAVGLRTRLDPHPPLTVYDSNERTGYKAIVADESGNVDRHEWATLAGWARAKQLPDGTPIDALRVIVPSRAAALALHPRAAADGIDAVLFSDSEGVWWNPSPPGLWQS
jgi:hypothetical protein